MNEHSADVQVDPETNLFFTEAKILSQLEDEIGQKFTKLDHSPPFFFRRRDFPNIGYQEIDHHITALNMNYVQLKHIPSVLKALPNLFYLDLNDNLIDQADLRILQDSRFLKNLSFRNNCLQSIDLSPLRYLPELAMLSLGINLLKELDLFPLQFCKKLRFIVLNSNCLTSIDLSPLVFIDSSLTLHLTDNPISKLNISPLLSLPKVINLTINPDTRLVASPQSLLYSSLFLQDHFDRIEWLIDETNKEEKALYSIYQKRVEHFQLYESWLSFRNRKLSSVSDFDFDSHSGSDFDSDFEFDSDPEPEFDSDSDSDSEPEFDSDSEPEIDSDSRQNLLDYMIDHYLKIIEQEIEVVDSSPKNLEKPFDHVIQPFQGQFLSVTDLVSVFYKLWILRKWVTFSSSGGYLQTLLSISIEEGDLLRNIPPKLYIFRYWRDVSNGATSQKIYLISWVRIDVWEEERIYHLYEGFNRGYLVPINNSTKLERFYPGNYPEDDPPKYYDSVEDQHPHWSMDRFSVVKNTYELLSDAGAWLRIERSPLDSSPNPFLHCYDL